MCRDRKVQDEGMVVRSFVLDLRISSDNAKLGLISIAFSFYIIFFWVDSTGTVASLGEPRKEEAS